MFAPSPISRNHPYSLFAAAQIERLLIFESLGFRKYITPRLFSLQENPGTTADSAEPLKTGPALLSTSPGD